MVNDYDIIILGAGTTAFAGARLATAAGKKVLLIEQSHIGGTCINWGCIPSRDYCRPPTHASLRRIPHADTRKSLDHGHGRHAP